MHSTISTRHQSLFIEDIALADIANQFGTPCYVYSKEAITQNFNAYQSALSERDHLICYAVKSNSNIAVLQTLANLRCGF